MRKDAGNLVDGGTRGRKTTRSVVLAGVGGQGTLFAASLLAGALLAQGFDVKTSEVHGMAQRGGVVTSMVRFGESVASPLVPRGEAEALVATEVLEALRMMEYLEPGGKIFFSRTRIDPLTVLQGTAEYPTDAEELVYRLAPASHGVDAEEIANEAGDRRAANAVLLGMLSNSLPVAEEKWLATIELVAPAGTKESNRTAFLLGRDLTPIPDGGVR